MTDISSLLDDNSAPVPTTKAKPTAAPATQKGHNAMKEIAESIQKIIAIRTEKKDLAEDEKALKKTLKENHEMDAKMISAVISLVENGDFEEYASRHDRILHVYGGIKNNGK